MKKILVFIFIIYISSFSILNIIIPDKEISNTERRKLKSFPSFKLDSDWIMDLDKYFLDHFIFRDKFRSIKAKYNYYLLNKLDNNGIYLKDNYIFKSNYPTNIESINNFIDKVSNLENLLSNDNNIYMMVIPDKNYYLNSKDFLFINYDYLYQEVGNLEYSFIDIRDVLELDDYYETDVHWRQEKLDKVIKKMSNAMDFSYKNILYNENYYDNFYGSYYGESAIDRDGERLVYLTGDVFRDVNVYYLENNEFNSIYNIDKLNGLDSYDVYLDGASSFVEIINNMASTNRELVIFRDSFGSSLSPLLVNYYSKITLIDNRYISSNNFMDMIDFTNQDVLFMYSTLFINDSFSLKG